MATGSSSPASSGFAQGLLQSIEPWITGGSPSALDKAFAPYGGFNGLLYVLSQDSPGSQGAAASGRALEQVQNEALQRAASRQQLAQGALGIQRMQAMMPLLGSIFRQAGASGGDPASPNASTADSGTQMPPGDGSGQPAAQGGSGAPGGAPIIGPFSAVPQATGATSPGAVPNSAAPPVGAPIPPVDPAQQAYQRLLAQYRLGAMLPLVGMNGSGFTKLADFQAANNPALITRRAVAGNESRRTRRSSIRHTRAAIRWPTRPRG